MTILYVEDDPDDQDFFCEALRICRPRAVCHCAIDGSEGLKILEQLPIPPDYIFTDLNMPNIGGMEFLKQVKQSEFRNIPVIVWTTSSTQKEKEKSEELGASRFVTKPLGIKQIAQILSKILV